MLLWAGAAPAATTYSNTSVPFAWIDATGHTKLGPTLGGVYSPTYKFSNTGGCGTTQPTLDDTLSDRIPLGFNFAFGSRSFDSLRINTNGRLQLTSIGAPALDNTTCGFGSPVTQLPMPDAGLNNTLRIYGNDLDPTSNVEVPGYGTVCMDRNLCFVSFATTGVAPNRRFVVTWSNIPEWTNTATTGGNYNLQAILQENGEFIYQFGTDVAGPAAATAQVGWQITTTDFEIPQVGFPANNTAIKFFIPTPVVEYKMEQSSWSGAAGQVLDTSGNGRHGTVAGGAQTTPSGKICYGATVPVNTSAAQIDAINSGINVPATVGGSGTITFWYKANTAWSGGGTQDAQLIDATINSPDWFFVVRRNTGQLRFVIRDSAGVDRIAETGAIAVTAGTWKHIAVSWSFNALAPANSDHMLIYVDGVLQTTLSFTTAGTLAPGIGTLYIGDNRSSAIGVSGSGRSLDGVIDEFRMYNYEGGIGLVQRDMNATTPCATISNFLINVGAASASTCAPKNITITARDATNATLTNYTGTINLSTSTSHGSWAKVSAGGTLVNGAADSGAASYSFVSGDNGVITLSIANTHAEAMTINVVDSSVGTTLSVSSTLTFLDNVFVISPTDSLGNTVVAGRNHAMKAEYYKKDSGGNCAVDINYTGNKNLDAWYVADASHPAGAAAPAISTGSPPGTCNVAPSLTLSTTVPASSPGSNNLLNVPFAAGVWNFCLSTTDVGKFDLNLRDDTRVYATTANIPSTTNTLTVRPFALGFTGVAQGALANPGGSAAGGAKFVAAEDTFQATVGGYRWQAADDANNDGVPDSGADVTNNGLTPSYQWATTLAVTTPVTPAGGATGALGGGVNLVAGSFAGGTATVANLTYAEVGSMTMSATATNYLNSGITVSGASGVIGRFYPDHFALTAVTLLGACSGAFTYMDQPALNIAYTLQAQGKNNTVTTNYSAALAYPVGTVSLVAENANAGVNLSARISGLPAVTWSSGQYVVNSPNSRFTRAAAPDGAYDALAIGVRVVDADGAVLSARDMNAATTGACGAACDARQLGGAATTTRVRYGRLWLQNANGSELLALPVPMETQYYSSSGFTTNTLDSCTTIATANVGLGNYQGNLAAGETTATVAAGAFAAGKKTLTLSRPGSGNSGAVNAVVNLGSTTTIDNTTTCLAWTPAPTPAAANLPWLLGQWCGASANRSPAARATFGTYRNTNKFIFQRENY
jgi:hypothetical protein